MLSTSMPSDTLLVEHDGPGGSGSPGSGVAVVTFNRPQVRNALNAETLERLRRVMLELKDDESVRVVILTGAGDKAFVAGADIHELAVQTATSARAFALAGQRVFDVVEHLGKPVIAAINGYALGGGCELAMACTLRLAADTARIGQPEINLGIIPGYAGSQRLARLVGKGKAMELILTGVPISAAEAERIGLINRVVAATELMNEARTLGEQLARNAPIAMRYILDAVNQGLEMPFAEAAIYEATLFGLVAATEDMREGTRAFLEKRKPDFKGR
jgi:enoyl-CoA hydratase